MTTIRQAHLGELKTRDPFRSLFPIDQLTQKQIEDDMRKNSFDPSKPVDVWDMGDGQLTIVDGHTRTMAAFRTGTEVVWVYPHEFESVEDALAYAIHNQRDRRNLTDADIVRCLQALDEKMKRGAGQERSGNGTFQPKASNEANGENGKSAEKTADLLGISRTKVEKARTVLDHATPEVKSAVESGEMSINKAYNETQVARGKRKPKLDPPDEIADQVEEDPEDDPMISEDDPDFDDMDQVAECVAEAIDEAVEIITSPEGISTQSPSKIDPYAVLDGETENEVIAQAEPPKQPDILGKHAACVTNIARKYEPKIFGQMVTDMLTVYRYWGRHTEDEKRQIYLSQAMEFLEDIETEMMSTSYFGVPIPS